MVENGRKWQKWSKVVKKKKGQKWSWDGEMVKGL
jgi:hypothetical protein